MFVVKRTPEFEKDILSNPDKIECHRQQIGKIYIVLLCEAIEHSVHPSSNTVPLFAISVSQMTV
jgi:hypothetical protein